MFKKSKIALAVAALVATITLSGCFSGNPNNPDQNYAALKMFNKWNNSWTIADDADTNKWINAILGFFPGCIGYGICMYGDILVFNTIGFWSGDNPLASTETVGDVDYSIASVSDYESAEFAISDSGEMLCLAPAK